MRKPNRATLRNKLDKIVSELVRKRGKCEHCDDKKTLQCCHIFSRTYNNTRWDLGNLLCLCASCHFYFHKNPIAFVEFVNSYLGDNKYELLKEAHNQEARFTIIDLEIKYNILKEMLNEKETKKDTSLENTKD
jgi:hypothetical protein